MYMLVKLVDNSVFAGVGKKNADGSIKFESAHMIVFWDGKTKGLPGICSVGPGKGCRVSDAVEDLDIPKESIRFSCKMKDKAYDAVEAQPWA